MTTMLVKLTTGSAVKAESSGNWKSVRFYFILATQSALFRASLQSAYYILQLQEFLFLKRFFQCVFPYSSAKCCHPYY